MAGEYGYKFLNGLGSASDGSADATIIAAKGAGTVIRVLKAIISVTTAAAGGSGEVALEDGAGGDRIFEADADAVGVYTIDFEPIGYPLTANTALNLTVDGAVTTEASATATVLAIQT
jgi:hypothetical protein